MITSKNLSLFKFYIRISRHFCCRCLSLVMAMYSWYTLYLLQVLVALIAFVVHAVSVAGACRWWRCVRGSRCFCYRCLPLVALCLWLTLFLLQVLVAGDAVFMVHTVCYRCLLLVALCSWLTLTLLQVLVAGGAVYVVRRKKRAASGK